MNDRAWIATRKGLFELRRSPASGWTVAGTSFLGEPVSMVLPPQPGLPMLAALNLGHFGTKLHASDDEGRSWRELPTPVYPPQPALPDGADPALAGPAWKLVMIWSLEGAGGRLWAGTLPGGLFVSEDRGEHWQLVESLWQRPERLKWFGGGYDVPGIHSICLHPGRADELLLGVSCGGVWRSQDGGAHWSVHCRGMRADYMPPELSEDEAIQDLHAVVRCAGEPDVLWCQHHNGIWRSSDNAGQWVRLEAPVSSFGFVVGVHPGDGKTAWFVPAQSDQRRVPSGGALIVNRTTDGGASFQTFRTGLPQQDCYDLIYRHGLAVAGDGRTLLMGSTTGGLWASGDAGEAWQMLPMRLPPVHAVRFG